MKKEFLFPILISHANAMEKPAPAAGPVITAIVGIFNLYI